MSGASAWSEDAAADRAGLRGSESPSQVGAGAGCGGRSRGRGREDTAPCWRCRRALAARGLQRGAGPLNRLGRGRRPAGGSVGALVVFSAEISAPLLHVMFTLAQLTGRLRVGGFHFCDRR